MRLATMIPRLTPPRIIRGSGLPTFGQICRPSKVEGRENEDDDDDDEEPSSFESLLSQQNNEHSNSNLASSPLFSNKEVIPRCIFLGEQHHQPKVLSSQLQILYQLFQACKNHEKVHVVFEHWSLNDQPYLNQLNNQNVDEFDPRNTQEDSTSEGFSASHYLTLVKLVRELGGTVWGGFPPRSWARLVSKSETCVLEEIQKLDQTRFASHGGLKSKDNPTIPPLPIEQYSLIENISWQHRMYLKSMFRPDLRPRIQPEVKGPPPTEKNGFLAAQALKDTFFAHTMSSLLKRDSENIVVGIVGLGHCEWGYGAPERLKSLTGLDSFIALTKPEDAGQWDAFPESCSAKESSTGDWNNRQADAIVLYEWID